MKGLGEVRCKSSNDGGLDSNLNPSCGIHSRYYVSQHPEVEQKIAAELDSLGLLATADQPQPRPVAFDDIGKLTYLGNVVKVLAAVFQLCAGSCSVDLLELAGLWKYCAQ